jgi:peptidoglycan/LPS O-acetylase OafA/YrhL
MTGDRQRSRIVSTMSERRFSLAVVVVACATAAAVALHDGLGGWDALVWVGGVAAAVALIGLSFFVAEKLAPDGSLAQTTLAKPVGATILGAGVVVVGLVTGDDEVLVGGVVAVVVFGFLMHVIRGSERDTSP